MVETVRILSWQISHTLDLKVVTVDVKFTNVINIIASFQPTVNNKFLSPILLAFTAFY